MIYKTEFYKKNTRIKNFIPLPRFIFKEDLSASAKLIYGLLVARTMVSQREENADRWSDTAGNIYIMYTIQNRAKDSGLSTGAVKSALAQLKEADLVETIKNGNNKPNTIFVKYPKSAFDKNDAETCGPSIDGPRTDDGLSCNESQKVSLREDKKYPSCRTDSDSPERQKLPRKYTDTNNRKSNTDVSEMDFSPINRERIERIRTLVDTTAERLSPERKSISTTK